MGLRKGWNKDVAAMLSAVLSPRVAELYNVHGTRNMVNSKVYMVQENETEKVGTKTKMLSAVLSPVGAALEGSSGPS